MASLANSSPGQASSSAGLPPLVPVPEAVEGACRGEMGKRSACEMSGAARLSRQPSAASSVDEDFDSDNSDLQYESEEAMSDGENDEDDSGFNEGTGTNNLRSKSVNRLDRQIANAQRICPPQGGVFAVPCNRELDRHHVYLSFPVPSNTSGPVSYTHLTLPTTPYV